MKLKRWTDTAGGRAGYSFWCEGCGERHAISTEGPGPQWSFNGDMERPVFSPSVLVTGYSWVGDTDEQVPIRCHTFVGCNGAQPGEIVYLGDCSHELRGARPLLDLPGVS